MSTTKLYIPKTIKVGYQNRTDTYTGKLAYVIYTDDKGVLRKEKSWQGWRDHKIKIDDFDNEPTSGFVLNKGVGGARHSWSHWTRNEYVRVYDPRNFEFEISIANMLFILQENSSIKGKGLEGEFVYSWDGTELMLLPVGSVEYDESIKHTERQKIKFDKNDLQEGYSYVMKDGTSTLYLGRHNYNRHSSSGPSPYSAQGFNPSGKRHIFYILNHDKNTDPYIAENGLTGIAERTSSTPLATYPDEYDKFKKSVYCADIKEVKLTKLVLTADLIKESWRTRTLAVKRGEKYFPAHLTVRYSYSYNPNPSRNSNLEIRIGKTPFVPEVKKNGSFTVPKSDAVDLITQPKNEEFYSITLTNDGGKHFTL